jgi:hypothetical protein
MSEKLTSDQVHSFSPDKKTTRRVLRQNVWSDTSQRLESDAALDRELNNWKEEVAKRLTEFCTPRLADGPLKSELLGKFSAIKDESHAECLDMLDALAEQFAQKRPRSVETDAPPIKEEVTRRMHEALQKEADAFREIYAQRPVSRFMSLVQLDERMPTTQQIRDVFYKREKKEPDVIETAYKAIQGPEEPRLKSYIQAASEIFDAVEKEFDTRRKALRAHFEKHATRKNKKNGGWVVAEENGTPATIITTEGAGTDRIRGIMENKANATLLPVDHLTAEQKNDLMEAVRACPDGDAANKFQVRECKMLLGDADAITVNALAVRDHNGLPIDPALLKKTIEGRLRQLESGKEISADPAPGAGDDKGTPIDDKHRESEHREPEYREPAHREPERREPTDDTRDRPGERHEPRERTHREREHKHHDRDYSSRDSLPRLVERVAEIKVSEGSRSSSPEKPTEANGKGGNWADVMPWVLGAVGSLVGLGFIFGSKRKKPAREAAEEMPPPAFSGQSTTEVGAVSDPRKPMRMPDYSRDHSY